ncbi:MAG: hypothetical protein RL021_1280 [Bacteroidota bacterium]|jgi:membrane protein required for colicin V production
MNWIDLMLGIILLAGFIRGFLNGFVYEIAHLGAFFLGYFAAFKLTDTVVPSISRLLEADPSTVRYISFFMVFLAVWIGVVLLGKLFDGLVSVTLLGVFNKIAGAVFGLLKYLVVTSVLVFFFHKADSRYRWISPDTKAASRLYYPVLHTATGVLPVLEQAKDWAEDGKN